jgi:cell division protein FtsZ
MVFVTAGMGGGTGTGAAPVVARAAKEMGILTVGVVTKPFHFEGSRRMRVAEAGITELQKAVDTLLIIPNQNLFRVANEKTTFADAFAMADQVLYSGVACITDLMVKEGLINLDFADVRAVMREMGKAMMGTGEASGEKRALRSAEAAISNPLIDDVSMKGARGLLVSITGGRDLTLYEVDEAATRIREEVDQEANIIVGATFDESLEGIIRVSVVATGIDMAGLPAAATDAHLAELSQKLRTQAPRQERAVQIETAPAVERALGQAAEASRPMSYDDEAAAPLPPAATIEDVTIRPLAPKPSLFVDSPEMHPEAPETAPAKAFIPPSAERAPARPTRMPRLDEFPLPVQNEMRARREPAQEQATPDKRRMSLLQRLASVGLGRREDPAEAPQEARPAARPIPAPRAADRQPPQPRPFAPEAPIAEPVSEYARRPVANPRPSSQGLDPHGRPTPAPTHSGLDDDQLEIPAFLRRQAN